jgi:hypothetical protein
LVETRWLISDHLLGRQGNRRAVFAISQLVTLIALIDEQGLTMLQMLQSQAQPLHNLVQLSA